MGPRSELKQLIDTVLIEGLTQGAKDSIDDALAKGGDPEKIRESIERGAKGYPMTQAAAEAYLEQRLKEMKEGRGRE